MSDSPNKMSDKWKLVTKSVRGVSHDRKALPNQDSVFQYVGDEIIVLAVSDGHGSSKCFYSEFGSKHAVQVCVDELKLFYEQVCKVDTNSDYFLEKKFVEILPQRIYKRWMEENKKHWEANPVTIDFLRARPSLDRDMVYEIIYGSSDKFMAEAYGATLLAVLITPEFMFGVQIGDGDSIECGSDFQFSYAIPKDPNLFGNETTSLCMKNAEKYFRTMFKALKKNNRPNVVMLSSDGFSNSYSSDDLFFNDLKECYVGTVREWGVECLEKNLEEWLRTASRDGSGDDITAGFIFHDSILPHCSKTEQNQ